MSVQPMTDHVLVRRAKREEMSNGVLLPRTPHDDKTTEGVICAVGPKVADVVVGDCVMFPKYCNKEFVIDGHKYLLLREVEIFAVVA